jgi:hypothetical protein
MLTNTSQRWLARNVRLNNAGYRDPQEFTERRPPGVWRIGLLGDSFTAGYGIARVEDRFGDRLRARLEQMCPGRFQVYNLASWGDESAQHLAKLRVIARFGFEFDMFILAYNLNDGSPLLPQTNQIYSRIDSLKPNFWLFRTSYLLNFLYYRTVLVTVPESQSYYAWVAQAYHEPTWTSHRAELERIREHCRQWDIELRVVTFPLVAMLGLDYPLREAHRKLDQLWDELDVPHLDLLECFEGCPAGELVVNRFDGHPSVLAHRIAADAIFERLVLTDPVIEAVRSRGR